MPVQVFVMPVSPIRDKQIYALGYDYFSPTVTRKLQKAKNDLNYWIRLIQEQKDILEPVFQEAVDLTDTFGQLIRMVSTGTNPMKDVAERQNIQAMISGFLSIQTLRGPAPKTFEYFDMMNQKFIAYTQNFVESLSQSTQNQFKINPKIPTEFEIDKTLAIFQTPQFEQAPLAQSLYHLAKYIDLHIRIYLSFLKDLVPRKSSPTSWPKEKTSMSACGMALKVNKRIPIHTKLETLLYFSETKEVLKLKSTVVRNLSLFDEGVESNALNFDFPTDQDQRLIERQQELYQISRCLELVM